MLKEEEEEEEEEEEDYDDNRKGTESETRFTAENAAA